MVQMIRQPQPSYRMDHSKISSAKNENREPRNNLYLATWEQEEVREHQIEKASFIGLQSLCKRVTRFFENDFGKSDNFVEQYVRATQRLRPFNRVD